MVPGTNGTCQKGTTPSAVGREAVLVLLVCYRTLCAGAVRSKKHLGSRGTFPGYSDV
jgi:hypothetical protein